MESNKQTTHAPQSAAKSATGIDETWIAYDYDALGRKLSQTHRKSIIGSILPLGAQAADTQEAGTQDLVVTRGDELSRTDYVGPCVYRDGQLKMVLIDGGYIEPTGSGYAYRYYLRDHQGNVRAVIDHTGALLEANDYYPYGEPMATASAAPGGLQPYKYGGKELLGSGADATVSAALAGVYDFGARWHSSLAATFTQPDPKSESYPSISPYAYCAANPIRFVDPTGCWNVEVNASADRGKHPYAIFSAYSNNGKLFFRTVVKVQGVHRERNMGKGDTPTGKYKILQWIKPKEANLNEESFGTNHVLLLNYELGEGYPKRNSIVVHGGRNQEGDLTSTWGCIRMADEDIINFREAALDLKNEDGSLEQPGSLTVADDLESPVKYSDRDKIILSQKINTFITDLATKVVQSIIK